MEWIYSFLNSLKMLGERLLCSIRNLEATAHDLLSAAPVGHVYHAQLVSGLQKLELWLLSPASVIKREAIAPVVELSVAVVVGFVFIGIPLGMQIIEKAAGAYNRRSIIDYLSIWVGVGPKTLIEWSLFYVVMAMGALVIWGSGLTPLVVTQILYTGLLIVVFFKLIYMTYHWYCHILDQQKRNPEEILCSIDQLSNKHSTENLLDRIEIAFHGLRNDPDNAELQSYLTNNLRLDVLRTIMIVDLKTRKEVYIKPDSTAPLVTYCQSLETFLREVAHSTRAMNFRFQRLMFSCFARMYHHPDYKRFFGNSLCNQNTYDISIVLYDRAADQSRHSSHTGNLVLEGEWIRDIIDPNFEVGLVNPDGISDALQLWRDTVVLAGSVNPDALVRLFDNLKEACLQNHVGRDVPVIVSTADWANRWTNDYGKIGWEVSDIYEHILAWDVLQGQDSTIPDRAPMLFKQTSWKDYIEDAKASPQRPDCPSSVKDPIRACIQTSGYRSLTTLFAVISYKGHWQQLKSIWYHHSPEGIQSYHLGHNFFHRDVTALLGWIYQYIPTHQDLHLSPMADNFIDNEPLSFWCMRCVVALVADALLNSNTPSVTFREANNNLQDLNRAYSLLDAMTMHLDVLEKSEVLAAFQWSPIHVESLYEKLSSEPEGAPIEQTLKESFRALIKKEKLIVDSKLRDIKRHAFPDTEKYPEDNERLQNAFTNTHCNFLKDFAFAGMLSFSDTLEKSELQQCDISQLCNQIPSNTLCPRASGEVIGLDFGGAGLSRRLELKIAKRLKTVATGKALPMPKSLGVGMSLFLDKSEFNPSDIPPHIFSQARFTNWGFSLAVEKNAFRVTIEGTHNDVIDDFIDINLRHPFKDNHHIVEGELVLRFELTIRDSSKIAVLNSQ